MNKSFRNILLLAAALVMLSFAVFVERTASSEWSGRY